MEAEIYEAIGRYVAGEMQDDELRTFEERLKTDSDLNEKVTLFREAYQSLGNRFGKEEELAAFRKNLSEFASDINEPSANKKSMPKWYVIAAAASVLLCAVIFYGIYNSKPDYKEYAVFEPLAITGRSSASPLKVEAEKNFNSKHYREALAFIEAVLLQDPDNYELKLYEGITMLQLNQADQADVVFKSVRDASPVYKDKALWWLSLSALKQEKYDVCRSYLQEIAPGADDYEKARKLLNDL